MEEKANLKYKVDIFNENPIIYGIFRTYDDLNWEVLKVSTDFKQIQQEVKYLNLLPIYYGK
jgi:hypothetical protein